VNEVPKNYRVKFSNQNILDKFLISVVMINNLNCHNTMIQIKKHKTGSIAVILFRKGNVNEGKDRKRGDEGPILQHCQESEPRDDPNICPNPGKSKCW